MASKTTDSPHRWRFFRAGGVDQARLDTGADLLAIEDLDQKLWVALSCPVKGLEFDERTLALIDTDHDGRVRAQEMIDAVNWISGLIKNADELVKASETLPLKSINDAGAEGKRLLAAARHMLAGLGKKDATAISVEDTQRTSEMFKQTRFNGDGVLPPESVEDAAAKQVASEVIACLGGETDRSGLPGITQAKLDQFFAELGALDEWWRQAETEAKKILPLGDRTVPALDAMRAVRVKIDDYFARCRLAAYDPRALAAVNRQENEYLAIAARDMSITAQELAGFPVAKVEAQQPLPLTGALNPAWIGAVARFREQVVAPLLAKDQTTLTEAEWSDLSARFAPHEAWHAGKKGASVEPLGLKRVREILAGKSKAALTELIAQDQALEPEINAIASVEKLARYYRDLHILLNNFVSFTDFYSRRRKAVFQVGTLYLDGRACELCMRVEDPGKHATLAIMAKSYLTYCDCVRPATGEKMTIAAAFTAGDSDNLFVGRNGVFYDRRGRDWDATVTKIVDNPISIGQAFLAPYKRLLRWIEEQVAKRAAAADEAASAKLTTTASAVGTSAATGKGPAEKPKFDVGVVAALGVAVGGITAAIGAFMEALFGLGKWIPLGVVGLVLAISGPSMIIAWLKLRQRNLGPILDANGWAVNGRVKINIPFGGALTATPSLPPGSERSLKDPYAPKKSIWPAVIIVLLVLAAVAFGLYKTGYVKQWLPKVAEWIETHIEAKVGSLAAPAASDKPATEPAK